MTSTRVPRAGTKRVLSPVGLLDITDSRVTAHTGHRVEIVQPFGCPRNGTMNMAYVDCITCGDHPRMFIGLVNIASLVK
jgi:hypothetical protein